jgi:hypothetical protein
MAVKTEEAVLADMVKFGDDRQVKPRKITLIYNPNPEDNKLQSPWASWEAHFDGIWVAEDAY